MPEFWTQPWFGWAIAIVLGLPVLLLVLTELHASLVRRGNAAAKPVLLLRNFVIPVGAILALSTLASEVSVEVTWVKVVATVFGFLVILLLLSGVNVVLFSNAQPGSWRDRLPSIFVDLGRLVLIIVGLAILFSWVWSADVGGLFAALGVTSIVIGLALQNAVGSVISGLLLLFEQPFRLGDWLDTGSVRGRVVEVNWRAVHIDTGNGIQIVPNASLADSSFTNLSRAQGAYSSVTVVKFATDDPPHDVVSLLVDVAGGLPQLSAGMRPTASVDGNATYSVTLPLTSPSVEGDAVTLLLGWLWYAARRRGLHLDGDLTDDFPTPERTRASLERIAPTLHLNADDVEALASTALLERYAGGETVQKSGEVPAGLRFVVAGTIGLIAEGADGARVPLGSVDPGGYLGQNGLTRERAAESAVAQQPTTVLFIEQGTIDSLVRARPALAREIGQSIDARRAQLRERLEAAGL
ncbi:mechanosensitive ion channel [Glaciihabitans arcticus]|uniref:Mechanosensitive ion channel n=1 Tax=Glaciihabitans arcticus TaxID=2668039 RepID=A0A4Q9GQF3_9MICO|nr:mechanosensitive ion channel domain-containing protein [Glaciihabitans arcticus]TBN55485.1 mechanosensitive ion channel [Glaciihabitans arcticus]